jgi:polyhydroxyalkanoate synthesis repressor PhaR
MVERKYMTLHELADLIRKGQQIKVLEAKTDADVTACILTQILLEQGKNKGTLLPVPLLHLIIRYGDNVLNDFFETYLQQIIGNYLEYKQALDAQFLQWLDLGKNLTATTQRSIRSINPYQGLFKSDDDK